MVDHLLEIPAYFAKDGEDSPELNQWKRDHPDWFVAGHWIPRRSRSGTGGPARPGWSGERGGADDALGGAGPTGLDTGRRSLPGTAPDWGRPMSPDELGILVAGDGRRALIQSALRYLREQAEERPERNIAPRLRHDDPKPSSPLTPEPTDSDVPDPTQSPDEFADLQLRSSNGASAGRSKQRER